MLKMKVNSSLPNVLCNDVDLCMVTLNNTAYIYNLSILNVDKVLDILDLNKDIIKSITVHHIDYTMTYNTFIEGLTKLVNHLIYKEQKWSKDDTFNVIVYDDTVKKNVKEKFESIQKKITKYSFNIFPKVSCVDVNPLNEIIRGGDVMQIEPYLTTLKLDVENYKTFTEIITEYDSTKDKQDSVYTKKIHIFHTTLDYTLGITIVRKMGSLITSKNTPSGNISFDISNVVKVEEIYVPKESNN